MSVSLTDLKLEVKKRLDQAFDMSLGEVADGTGGVSQNNDDVLLAYLNLGQQDIARECCPIFGKAQMDALPTGTRTVQLHTLPPIPGFGRLWAARTVFYDTRVLQYVRYATLANRSPGYEFKPNGSPSVWFDAGIPDTIGIDPAPGDGTRTLTVAGLCLPPLLGDGTNGTVPSVSFLPDDEAINLVPVAAAILIAKKKYDDGSVYGRLSHLIPDYDERRTRLYAAIEPELRAWRYPVPPVLTPPDPGGGG